MVFERNGPQNLKTNLFIKTENNLVMILCVIYLRLPFSSSMEEMKIYLFFIQLENITLII